MIRTRFLMGLSLLFAVSLVGCGVGASAAKSSDSAASSEKRSAAPGSAPTTAPTGGLVQIGQVSYSNWGERDAHGEESRGLDAGDFYYKGTFIHGEPGQKLTLEIKNVAQQVHNISIPSQGVDTDIPPNSDRVNVDVTFPQSGGLQFFCKYHTSQGMNGLLLVGDTTPQSFASPQPASSPQPAGSPQPIASPQPRG